MDAEDAYREIQHILNIEKKEREKKEQHYEFELGLRSELSPQTDDRTNNSADHLQEEKMNFSSVLSVASKTERSVNSTEPPVISMEEAVGRRDSAFLVESGGDSLKKVGVKKVNLSMIKLGIGK